MSARFFEDPNAVANAVFVANLVASKRHIDDDKGR